MGLSDSAARQAALDPEQSGAPGEEPRAPAAWGRLHSRGRQRAGPRAAAGRAREVEVLGTSGASHRRSTTGMAPSCPPLLGFDFAMLLCGEMLKGPMDLCKRNASCYY